MSEEEKDILVTKRKYWAKLMKYNLVGTVLFLIYVFVILSYELAERCEETSFSDGTAMCNSVLISYLLLSLFLLGSWPLSLIMYGYQSFKIYKITKPKVLTKSSGMTTTQITSIKEAKELLDKKIITNSEFEKIKNEYADEDVVTRLKGIAELRDSGVFTESEFLEHKSKILSETSSQTDENLNSNNYDKYLTGKAVTGYAVIGTVAVILIISVFGYYDGGGGARAYVEGTYASGYEMCWSGAFHNGDSIISISGCGAETFSCSDRDFCSINAQKEEDNSHELCVRIGSREACTTAAYGVAQV